MFVVTGALDYGQRHVKINGYPLYGARWYGEQITLTEDEVDGIIAGIGRVNKRWPATFVAVSSPKPMPDDLSETIWIFDSSALWPLQCVQPTVVELIRIATGNE